MNIPNINDMMLQNANLTRTTSTDFESAFESALADAQKGDTSNIRAAAQEMESFFIYQLFQAMRRTVPEPQGIFERSTAERIFQEMLDEETANNLARAGGIGLADKIYEQLTRSNRRIQSTMPVVDE